MIILSNIVQTASYMWIKKCFIIVSFVICVLLIGCGQISNGQSSTSSPTSKNLSKVQSWFIQENLIMTERDALSREIDYYRPPKIVRSEMLGWIDGKCLIHIANSIKNEDDEKPMTSFMGSSPMKIIRNVQDIKDYGLNHPNDYIAELYVFGGDFVHYSRGIKRIWNLVVYIPEIDRYVEVDAKHIAGQPVSGFQSKGYEWIANLPVYEDLPLQ